MDRSEYKIPDQLDGRPYMFPATLSGIDVTQNETNSTNKIMYNLCSVIHHLSCKSGKLKDTNGVEGHFTAAVKIDNNWISVDDEKMAKINAINGSTARILFYRKIEQEDAFS